jgi:hypothetical protein
MNVVFYYSTGRREAFVLSYGRRLPIRSFSRRVCPSLFEATACCVSGLAGQGVAGWEKIAAPSSQVHVSGAIKRSLGSMR